METEVVKYMNLVKRDSDGLMNKEDFRGLVERVYYLLVGQMNKEELKKTVEEDMERVEERVRAE